MTKNGIDVSEHQGKINWDNVKTDFAILRAGYGRELSQKEARRFAKDTLFGWHTTVWARLHTEVSLVSGRDPVPELLQESADMWILTNAILIILLSSKPQG